MSDFYILILHIMYRTLLCIYNGEYIFQILFSCCCTQCVSEVSEALFLYILPIHAILSENCHWLVFTIKRAFTWQFRSHFEYTDTFIYLWCIVMELLSLMWNLWAAFHIVSSVMYFICIWNDLLQALFLCIPLKNLYWFVQCNKF